MAPTPPRSPSLQSSSPYRCRDKSAGSGTLDENKAVKYTTSGNTLFNEAITQLQQLHNQVAMEEQVKSTRHLQEISGDVFRLKKGLRRLPTQEEKQNVAEQITHLQHESSSYPEAAIM
jgi:hypothetical protein